VQSVRGERGGGGGGEGHGDRRVSGTYTSNYPKDPFQTSASPPHSGLRKLEIERTLLEKQPKSAGAREFRKESVLAAVPADTPTTPSPMLKNYSLPPVEFLLAHLHSQRGRPLRHECCFPSASPNEPTVLLPQGEGGGRGNLRTLPLQ
jgi:hypothetical protein